MSHRLPPDSLQKRYLSNNKGVVVLTFLIILCIIFFSVLFYSYKDFVYATGGAFPFTKHGGGTTDGESPYDVGSGSGVDRSINPDYPVYYNDQVGGEAGRYVAAECTHCHEPHASFGTAEPLPDITSSPGDAGPDTYLLMKEYGTDTADSYAELCWYCHENMNNINGSGYGIGYGRWGFYQGKTVYQSSSHYNPPAGLFYWPGTTGASIWPRKDRQNLPLGNRGSCLNCHTPHGIRGKSGAEYDTTSPDGTGGVPANRQTVASGNPSVNEDYLIPRQLIAWEEMLCENCHDAGGPSTRDIQTEINKRHQVTGSGHPVDDTNLAGRHVVSEGLPVTDTTPPTGVYDPNKKHVECYDCHNPHADKTSNRLEGMKYIEINGTLRDPANGDRQPYVYEVCIKCHGDSHNSFIPDRTATGTPVSGNPLRTTVAQYGCAIANPASGCTDGSNKRLELNPASTGSQIPDDFNPSLSQNTAYHPVASPGRNLSPALCKQLRNAFGLTSCPPDNTTDSVELQNLTINCTDCHNNDATNITQGPVTESNIRGTDVSSGYGGTDPVGPHGSQNTRILRANYNTTLDNGAGGAPFVSYDPNNFALCFLCHDEEAFTLQCGLGECGGWTDGPKTNFYSTVNDANLHASHIAAKPVVASNGAFTTCANCHYNVHSNVEAANTMYHDSADSLSWNRTTDNASHLINFSPIVGPSSWWTYTKPFWGCIDWFGWRMGCDFNCHGFDQELYYTAPNITNSCNY